MKYSLFLLFSFLKKILYSKEGFQIYNERDISVSKKLNFLSILKIYLRNIYFDMKK